ncbi:hypothetical protein HRI_000413900 [Hibiscus trionum]|uniref:Endonuclease/exonuclease/phosphatase domain-containing protein n=1 Tax=Hibiscus trionum TaxID=183268 RepID=A0A9W7LKJ1_HIBTR|nr:hypothetical protein HRI_000413900 [Hibiscus trionum]
MNQSILITWNVRGIGSFEKKAATRRVLFSSKTSILFIQETKIQVCDEWVIKKIVGSSGNYGWCFSPPIGRSGGLLSIWDTNIFDCQAKFVHRNYIMSVGWLKVLNIKLHCSLVNVYAPNGAADRKGFFLHLSETLSRSNMPLIIGGDFNTICRKEEKVGVSFKKGEMKVFVEFINSLSLLDIPLEGGTFTWSNYRDNPSMSRLDRILLSPEVMQKWLNLQQKLMPKNISDHNPVNLTIAEQNWGPKPFHWFDHWSEEEELVGYITKTCQSLNGAGISDMLRRCKQEAKVWHARKGVSNKPSIAELENRITELEAKFSGGKSDSSLKQEILYTKS